MNDFNLQGLITALITPFKEDGSLDFTALKKLINFQIDNGSDAIVVCSTTGESPTLTTKDRQSLVVRAVEYAAGRIPVIVGTGTNETQNALDQTTLAKELGASAVLLVTPYYNKPSQDGLFEHFKVIADNVDIPQIIYNVPSRTGVNMRAETQLRLAEACPNVVAVKESSEDMGQMMEIIKHAPKHFSVFTGEDYLAVPSIIMGAKGVVSVIANYAPKQFAACVHKALDGHIKEAVKIHYSLLELMKLNFIESNPMPVKAAAAMLGLAKEVYRMPMLPLQLPHKKLIKAALIDAGFMKATD